MKNFDRKAVLSALLLTSMFAISFNPAKADNTYNNQGTYTAQYTPGGYYNPYQNSNGNQQTNPNQGNYNTQYPSYYPANSSSGVVNGSVVKNKKIPLYRNQSATEISKIINEVGIRLVQKNNIKTPIKFVYDPSSTVNAYTQIGGTITIFKGMLEYCDDGDELAAVLGHEMGHATSYHGIKSTAVSYVEGYTSPILKQATVGRISNPYLRTAASLLYNKTEEAGRQYYERGQEIDADLLSVDYLVAAGYNPCAFISIMNKSMSNYFDLWAGHPSTDKRIVKVYNYIKQKYPKFLEDGYDSDAYRQAIALYIK